MPQTPFENDRSPNERRAGRAVRWGISVLLVLYGGALFSVAAGSNSLSPPPLISAYILDHVGWLLHPFQLDIPHRYYTPDPAPQQGLWLRIVHEGGAIRWVAWPTPDQANGAMHVRRQRAPGAIAERQTLPNQPGFAVLTPMSRIVISSLARRLVRELPLTDDDGSMDAVAALHFYSIDNSLLTPGQIQAGWGFHDLRLTKATYLGGYGRSGDKLGESVCASVPVHEIAARIIEEQVAPAAETRAAGEAVTQFLQTLSLPPHVTELLQRHPELVKQVGVDLRQAIREAVFRDDDPEIELTPGLDFPEEWVTTTDG